MNRIVDAECRAGHTSEDHVSIICNTANIQNGNISIVGGKYKLSVSVSFTSPSSAAMFVLDSSTNGRVEWKNKDGKTLDELFRK